MIARVAPTDRLRTFDRFNKMMEEMLGGDRDFNPSTPWLPAVDIKETEKELTFLIELPGIAEKDIDVEVVGDLLTISGKREVQKDEKKEDYVRIERNYGSFLRTFKLDAPTKPDEIMANFKEGLLTVVVPKTVKLQPAKVAIRKV